MAKHRQQLHKSYIVHGRHDGCCSLAAYAILSGKKGVAGTYDSCKSRDGELIEMTIGERRS